MDLREVSKGTIEGSKLFHFFSSSQFFDARVLINSVGIDQWGEANSSSREIFDASLSFLFEETGRATFPSSVEVNQDERALENSGSSLSSSPSSFIEHGK